MKANAPQASSIYGQFLQGPNTENLNGVFQKAYLDPAMQAFQGQIVPGIQQRFADVNASSSSALNRALADAASGLATQLGSQYGGLYQQAQTNQLNALSGLGGLAGQQTFNPVVQRQEGILGSLLGAAGQIGGSYFGGGLF